MYAVGNIILGTHLPWDPQEARKVVAEMVRTWPEKFRESPDETDDDALITAALEGSLDEIAFEIEPWHTEYHGGAESPVAWVGVCLGTFDETDHIRFQQLVATATPSPEQMVEAGNAYAALPESVRALLPPLSIYVVWGTS